MKKYNKPEIVTLALDAVDVIETSVGRDIAEETLVARGYSRVAAIEENINQMSDDWNW